VDVRRVSAVWGADALLRHARRVVLTVIGATVVLLGIALLVLPGPGTLVIFVGLGVLAIEFAWARRLLKKVKGAAVNVAGKANPRNWGKTGDPPAEQYDPGLSDHR
jgi:uncharacterized protein (TIGR02611 family)